MKDSNRTHGQQAFLPQKRGFHQTDLNSFIITKSSKKNMSIIPVSAEDGHSRIPRNELAEMIAQALIDHTCTTTSNSNHTSTHNPLVNYLTNDGESWYIHMKGWYLPPKQSYQETFDYEWNLHPLERRELKLYGKTFLERRWSQCWGQTISYSGLINQGRSIDESTVVQHLFNTFNSVIEKTPLKTGCYRRIDGTRNTQDDQEDGKEFVPPYNACLQNWYEVDDTIGLHADDESHNRQEFPIFSLSWGGTRRLVLHDILYHTTSLTYIHYSLQDFCQQIQYNPSIILVYLKLRFLFRSKEKRNEKVELYLENGDLLCMGGSCQQTHKHEIPKRRATMDPLTSNRINWTIRAVSEYNNKNINE